MREDRMLVALEEAHRIIRILCEMQDELARKAGKPKKDYVLADYSALRERLTRDYLGELKAAKAIARKAAAGEIDPETVTEETVAQHLYLPDVPDPELMIRTRI